MKILDVAREELGYLENNGFTKYGAWYGINPGAWCNMFVAYIAYQSGESAAVGKFAYVPYQVDFFKDRGRYYPKEVYTPVSGDIIFFEDESHVGIVEGVANGVVQVIEGNSKNPTSGKPNGVFRKRYNTMSSYIEGYGHPNYRDTTKEDDTMVYHNGSTPEPVYADTELRTKIGELNAWETCAKLGNKNGRTIVLYQVDDETRWKVGFVAYEGR